MNSSDAGHRVDDGAVSAAQLGRFGDAVEGSGERTDRPSRTSLDQQPTSWTDLVGGDVWRRGRGAALRRGRASSATWRGPCIVVDDAVGGLGEPRRVRVSGSRPGRGLQRARGASREPPLAAEDLECLGVPGLALLGQGPGFVLGLRGSPGWPAGPGHRLDRGGWSSVVALEVGGQFLAAGLDAVPALGPAGVQLARRSRRSRAPAACASRRSAGPRSARRGVAEVAFQARCCRSRRRRCSP